MNRFKNGDLVSLGYGGADIKTVFQRCIDDAVPLYVKLTNEYAHYASDTEERKKALGEWVEGMDLDDAEARIYGTLRPIVCVSTWVEIRSDWIHLIRNDGKAELHGTASNSYHGYEFRADDGYDYELVNPHKITLNDLYIQRIHIETQRITDTSKPQPLNTINTSTNPTVESKTPDEPKWPDDYNPTLRETLLMSTAKELFKSKQKNYFPTTIQINETISRIAWDTINKKTTSMPENGFSYIGLRGASKSDHATGMLLGAKATTPKPNEECAKELIYAVIGNRCTEEIKRIVRIHNENNPKESNGLPRNLNFLLEVAELYCDDINRAEGKATPSVEHHEISKNYKLCNTHRKAISYLLDRFVKVSGASKPPPEFHPPT